MFPKKLLAFITSLAPLVLIALIIGIPSAFATITFNASNITVDSSFTGIVGVASTTLDLGSSTSTLSLQTTNNGPITAGSGLFTIGGNLSLGNASGTNSTWSGFLQTLGQLIFGNASGTNISVTGYGTFPTLNFTSAVGTNVSSTRIDATTGGTIANVSSTNITVATNSQLGTVKSGTWNGTVIGTGFGGTGTTTLPIADQWLISNGTLYVPAKFAAGTNITITSSTTGGITTYSFASTVSGGGGGVSTSSPIYAGGIPFFLENNNSSTVQTASTMLYASSTGVLAIGTSTITTSLNIATTTLPTSALFNIGTSTQIFTVLNTGNVGIGTTTPANALDVVGSVNFTTKLLEDGNEVFATMLAPFAGACPTGWTEYTAARGRVVVGTPSAGTNAATSGTALANLGTRTITDVPAHTHSVDPPSTATDSQGAHTHTFRQNDDDNSSGSADNNPLGGPSTATTNSSGAHTHSTDIAAFNSASTGSASVDVTMPYIQLTYCQKTAGADLAEIYPVSDPSISAGDIVSFDGANPLGVKRAEANEQSIRLGQAVHPLAGVISTQPGLLLTDKKDATNQRPIALSGRVPTKVNLEGGEIAIGDRITLSSAPGVGRKARPFDASVGIALEPYPSSSSGQGRIEIFINLQPGLNIQTIGQELLASLATSTVTTTSDSVAGGFLKNLFTRIISWFADAANGITKFFAKEVHTDKLCVGDTCVTETELKALLHGQAADATSRGK